MQKDVKMEALSTEKNEVFNVSRKQLVREFKIHRASID